MEDFKMSDLANEVKAVAGDLGEVKATLSDYSEAKAELEKLRSEHGEVKADLTAALDQLANHKASLRDLYGKSGADDWRLEFSNFVKAVYHVQKGLRVPTWLQKAADDYAVDVDASGGYLVPTLVGDAVTKLTLRHGQIWPNVNKVTVPDGVNIKYPWESTLASVGFETTQGTAGDEIDPAIVWGNDTLRSAWLAGYAKVANEAMTAPGISIPDNIAMQLMGQLVRKIEQGIIVGDDSASAYPHDGILNATGVNSQSALATATLANAATFVGECLADHEGSGDTAENFIITTDAVAFQMKSAAQAEYTWGNPETGTPGNLFGYRFITSPFCISTTNRMIMSPLGKITVGWSGNFRISFNESLGWTANETWLMASTHADWGLGNTDMHHMAVVTALS